VKSDLFSRHQPNGWKLKRLTNSGIEFGGRSFLFPMSSLHCVLASHADDSPLEGASSTDKDLLTEKRTVASTRAASQEAPEARQDRVSRLRQQVLSGTYEIPVTQLVRILADIILRRR
jgi:anti-sigma28 factor (negative regulator of flagellin synthesis)